MNYRIHKHYGEEPTSFEDFVKRFLKKDPDKRVVCKRNIVPIYIVNKVSGYMQEILEDVKEFCTLPVYLNAAKYQLVEVDDD